MMDFMDWTDEAVNPVIGFIIMCLSYILAIPVICMLIVMLIVMSIIYVILFILAWPVYQVIKLWRKVMRKFRS